MRNSPTVRPTIESDKRCMLRRVRMVVFKKRIDGDFSRCFVIGETLQQNVGDCLVFRHCISQERAGCHVEYSLGDCDVPAHDL